MKVGMLFPGYGTQFVGMGKELYDNHRLVQEYFEEASHCLDINFVKMCFASSDNDLSKIVHAYPALFLVSYATALVIKRECGLDVQSVAGYGIGEFSALCFARGINFPDGLYFISKMAQFYTGILKELEIKSILVEKLSGPKLKQICLEQSSEMANAQISVYETKSDHIVTGHIEAVEQVAKKAVLAGAKIRKTCEAVDGLHTPIAQQLFDQLKIYLNKIDFKDLEIPLITNTSAKSIVTAKKAEQAVMQQIVKPVCWSNILKQFVDMDIIIIPAPAKGLVADIKAYYPNKIVVGVDNIADLESFKLVLQELRSESENSDFSVSLEQNSGSVLFG